MKYFSNLRNMIDNLVKDKVHFLIFNPELFRLEF